MRKIIIVASLILSACTTIKKSQTRELGLVIFEAVEKNKNYFRNSKIKVVSMACLLERDPTAIQKLRDNLQSKFKDRFAANLVGMNDIAIEEKRIVDSSFPTEICTTTSFNPVTNEPIAVKEPVEFNVETNLLSHQH